MEQSDGSLWFTEELASKFGRILTTATPAHPGIVEFHTYDGSSEPVGITVDGQGKVYGIRSEPLPGVLVISCLRKSH